MPSLTTIKQLADIVTNIPLNRLMGIKFACIDKDTVTAKFKMKKEMIGNPFYGILHGGVISTALDVAGGFAAMVSVVYKYPRLEISELQNRVGKSSTINLNINYIHPGKGKHFTATASVLHSGNKICFTRIELVNDEKTLLAAGEGVYLIG